MEAFTWGAGGARMTQEQIAAQKKVAQALMEKGMDYSPIQSPWQGAARVAQALYGGLESGMADKAAAENDKANREMIASLLNGGGASLPPVSSSSPASDMPAPTAMRPSTNEKVYSANEPSPLDPPSGQDRDMAIRTVYGEDPGESALAVANVIRNRAASGKFGGDTIPGVVLAKNQFEPWNDPAARTRMASLQPGSPEYERLGKIVDSAYTGANDPTGGATHFFAPKAQAALGRDVPAWGAGQGQDIGPHRFFGGVQDGSALPPNATPAGPASPAPQQPASPQLALRGVNPAVVQALTSPYSSEATKSIAGILLKQQMTTPEYVPIGDNAILDKKTGRVVPVDANKKTDALRNLEAENASRKAQGLPPMTPLEFIERTKKAGAQNITVDQRGENAFATKAAQVQAERFDKLVSAGMDAQAMQGDLEALKEIGGRITTGKTAEIQAALGPYAEAVGIKVDGLDDLQAYKSIVAKLAPRMRVPGSGATSDYEMRQFLEALPGLGKTPGGNEIISNTLTALSEHRRAAGEIGSRALAGEITPREAEKQLRELPDPLTLWRKSRKGVTLKGEAPAQKTGGTTSGGLKWSVE